MIQTCIDWAAQQGYVALAPSLRGQDGGEGRAELCLGEAEDVAAGARLLRSLEMADPELLGIVGGSMGACAALRGAALVADPTVVVAFVPPTDWKALVAYHRTAWRPEVETQCDGTTRTWDVGGSALADTFDRIICGHPECTDADYQARSPLAAVQTLDAPTLVVTAGRDNVVPPEQQLLWSILRERSGRAVQVYVAERCGGTGTPAPAPDVLVHAPDASHLLDPGSITSGLAFLVQALDARAAAGAAR
jgi:dipeptidyl aminopeptidase/acylaminoacyl peptidase